MLSPAKRRIVAFAILHKIAGVVTEVNRQTRLLAQRRQPVLGEATKDAIRKVLQVRLEIRGATPPAASCWATASVSNMPGQRNTRRRGPTWPTSDALAGAAACSVVTTTPLRWGSQRAR